MQPMGKLPIVIGVLVTLVIGTVLAAGTVTYRAGAVSVFVHEKRSEGSNVRVILPAVLVRPALSFIPRDKLARHLEEIRSWLPAIRIASRELERCPDGPLVEVESPGEKVSIVKRGDALVIDVDSEEDTVHVAFPLCLVTAVAEKLEDSAPTI